MSAYDPKRTSNAKILAGNHKTEPVPACFKRPVMTIESIIRRRAFRDGFYDGRQGCPMRRLATRKARWLYALGRIFANLAPTNLQVYEQRHATEAAVAAFRAMPVRYMAR
jgi:hypothetical protein